MLLALSLLSRNETPRVHHHSQTSTPRSPFLTVCLHSRTFCPHPPHHRLSRLLLVPTMYHTPRALARKSFAASLNEVLSRFSSARGFCEISESSGGFLSGRVGSGARASSSFQDPPNSVWNLVAERSQFGSLRAENLRAGRNQALSSSVSIVEEFPKRAQGVRAEHSAALVEDEDNVGSMGEFAEVAHKLADAAGEIIVKYFRSRFQIIDKEDMSPVTIADRASEEAMCKVLADHFPQHAIYGEEGGLTMPEGGSDYVWVLDPIDGTKSFITGKPLFGTLIALVYKGTPVLGIIDQPVLKERWVGIQGQGTTLNGQAIQTGPGTTMLKDAYMYTTSPHMFSGEAEDAFIRIRNKVKIPLYGCDCYAYGLLAAGHVDLVVESGLKPYDYLALVPVVEGAGGKITNWSGESLRWWPEIGEHSVEVVASSNQTLHTSALSALAWRDRKPTN